MVWRITAMICNFRSGICLRIVMEDHREPCLKSVHQLKFLKHEWHWWVQIMKVTRSFFAQYDFGTRERRRLECENWRREWRASRCQKPTATVPIKQIKNNLYNLISKRGHHMLSRKHQSVCLPHQMLSGSRLVHRSSHTEDLDFDCTLWLRTQLRKVK